MTNDKTIKASKMLLTTTGAMFFFFGTRKDLEKEVSSLEDHNLHTEVDRSSLLVQIKNILLAIPEAAVLHLCRVPSPCECVFIAVEPEKYEVRPFFTLKIPQEHLLEAKIAINFHKQQGHAPHASSPATTDPFLAGSASS